MKRDALLSEARRATESQRRRVSEARAREHVGAAGWAQSSALEGILKLGREGLVVTDSLRQVVKLTTEQLRDLSLGALTEQREHHLKALEEIVESGKEQLTASQALEEMLCQALEDVYSLPLEDVNVRQLEVVHNRIQQQISALNAIIEAAKVQASTLEQVSALEVVSAAHHQRISEIEQLSAEDEVTALGQAGENIVGRIAELDKAPQQLDSLQQIGEAVVDKIPDTGAHPETQAETLEQLAETAQAKADELREG